MTPGPVPTIYDRIFTEAVNIVEFFHQAPGREELLSATLKQLLATDQREVDVSLVLLCAGKPETLLQDTKATPRPGAPGLYALAPHHRALIIVIAELPRTLETLLIRNRREARPYQQENKIRNLQDSRRSRADGSTALSSLERWESRRFRMIRLMGAGRTLAQAISDAKALHPEHKLRQRALRALVAMRLAS